MSFVSFKQLPEHSSLRQRLAAQEELRSAYDRIATLEADLNECLEYFQDHSDVNDGDYGEPSPNKEMRLASMIQESLHGPGNF